MFAMYDDDGLNFRSTIDHLYSLQEVTPLKAVDNNTKDKKNQTFQESLYKGKITKEATDKYKQIANIHTMQEIFHVEEIMSKRITTVADNKTIKECYDLMQERSIQQLPIYDHDKSHLKAIVTIHDIIRYIFKDLMLAEQNANDPVINIATKKIITTDPISDIRRVAKVMIDFNINAIPVVNSEDKLVGMVSRNDIVKAVSTIPHMQIWV